MQGEPHAVHALLHRHRPARPTAPDITDAVTAWAMFTASLTLSVTPFEPKGIQDHES